MFLEYIYGQDVITTNGYFENLSMNLTGISYSLNPINENLDYTRARHLLDRCMFGAKKSEIQSLVGADISTALNTLLQSIPIPEPPVSYNELDLEFQPGQTWIDAPRSNDYNGYRKNSFIAWWISLMMKQNLSLVEKMVLFWHNHFVTEIEGVDNAPLNYQYTKVLRANALGNFKQMAYEITVDPAMLDYLNGESNKATAPNENYGRELFELFTIGKGDQIADGNYTNYTEADIREAAKVLTGWRIDRTLNVSYFDTARHDKKIKVFSEAFGNAVLENHEIEEYQLLIDLIFNKKETARHLCRKLYRWFLYYDINQTIEEQIIEPLATTLFESNYELKPVLEQLLSSEHFFSSDYFGSQIKTPLDFSIGIFRKCEIPLSELFTDNYKLWLEVYYACRNMEMTLGDPPDVAGWPEYYKAPAYYELWINSATVPQRTSYSDKMASSGITKNGFKYVIDPFKLTAIINDPSVVSSLINEIADILLPVPLSETKYNQLKETLIPGLPDSTWTFEWNKYIANPNDATQKSLVSKKLLALIKAIFRMPEFYLC